MFKIVISELFDQSVPLEPGARLISGELEKREVKRYEQIVDNIDLPAVMAAVNRKKRAPRTPKAKQNT